MYKNSISILFAFILFFCCAIPNMHAQSKNTLYFELLGNGITYSVNYDMRFKNEPSGLGARIGIGYNGWSDASVTVIPVLINYLLGKEGHYLELGAGATILNGSIDIVNLVDDASGSTVLGTLSIMYRKQPINGGFMLKAGFTPMLSESKLIPWWPGIAIGYTW